MGRYSTTSKLKDSNGKRKLSTTIVPIMDESSEDVFIEITSPERLDTLAHLFYQDSTLWWVIAASNGLGKGTLIVPQNTTIRIPSKSLILQQINEANRDR